MKKKQEQHSAIIKFFVVIGDFFFVCLSFLLIVLLYKGNIHDSLMVMTKYHFVLIGMIYMVSLSYSGIILDRRVVFMENIINRVFKTILIFAGLILSSVLFLDITIIPAYYWLTYFFITFIFVAIWRLFFRICLKKYRSIGGNHRKVLVLGAGSVANEIYISIIKNLFYGYKFMGFFDDRDPKDYKVDSDLVKGSINDVIKYAEENKIDEIINALPAGDDRKALPILRFAENNLIRFFIVPDFKRYITKSVALMFWENIPIISLREEPLRNSYNQIFKRSFDIIVSTIFLVTIFPPLFLIIATLIKLTSKGPVFFKQNRTGENGAEFKCIKFRTMAVNKDADKVQATKGDKRVTKVGNFLRKTNLDEIPQFINVFIGNMSIVGPRPHMLKHTEIYSQLIDKYMVRHYVKPGITGWAQVTGYRGETKELSEMEGRIKQDVWYIENWTFWLDIKIIFMTVKNMLKGEEKAY